MRYVVAIGNFLFHIELYYCNRLNTYFTSNFVDVIQVSNWVAGKFEKLALFFFINFLSLTHVYPFFSLISIFLSHHTCLPFFSHLNFPLSLTTSIFLFFSRLKINSHMPISLFLFLFSFLILVSLFISPTSISYFFAFFFLNLKFSLSLSLSPSLSFFFSLFFHFTFPPFLSISQNSNLSTNYKTYLSNFHLTLISTKSKFSLSNFSLS